jgi:hypothetical protein
MPASLRPLWSCLLCALCVACSVSPVLEPAGSRPFDFARDSFAFDNQLEWRYAVDPVRGTTEAVGANPDSEYTQHCFVLSRSARQFYQFARFDPVAPALDEAGYRERVRAVLDHDPSETAAVTRVVIPGYASLRAFSRDHETLLKDELGSKADSYLQRGNWRMIFPFSRAHQRSTAATLAAEIAVNRPPVVHLATFPEIHINHAVVLYAVDHEGDAIRFSAYDPNDSRHPTVLVYDAAAGAFRFATTDYFAGGEVDVYEIYRSTLY